MKIISCLYNAAFLLLKMASRNSSIQQLFVKKLCVVCLLTSFFTLVSQICHAGWVPYDDFADGVRDERKWHYAYWEGGKSPQENDGNLTLSVGGGTGSMRLPLEVELEQAGIDFSEAENHSLIGIKDPKITGVRLDITLSGDSPLQSGVLLGFYERTGPQEISHASIELGKWDYGVRLNFEKELFTNGESSGGESQPLPANLAETYRVTMLRDSGTLKVFKDSELIATYSSTGEQVGFFIAAFNDAGMPMSATADNVQVFYPDNSDTDFVTAPSSLVGKLIVGYWNGPGGGVECHYFKNESELIFLDSEQYSVNEYAWDSGTGILNDYSFGEYFELSFETPNSGAFALYAENESPSFGAFVMYDGSWDLDGDGIPDGKEVEDGTLPNLSIPPDLESTRVVHGTVTDQNGSPLSGVQVTAHHFNPNGDSSYPLAWASTDSSGKYALERLAPGAYRIRFNGWADEPPLSDFAPQYFNNAPSLALAEDVILSPSGSVHNIDAVLAEASKVTGKITSVADGKPLENILVLAHRMMSNGEWDWSSWVNFTSSKSDGSYALNLPQGTYLVSFHDYNNKYYVTQFYDNQRKSDNASAVVLGSNSTVSNINASLAQGSYIEGIVRADANSAPLQGISVSVHEYNEEDDWWNWVGGSETDQSGAYSIGGLGAGTYRVEFRDSNGVYAFEAYNDAANVGLGDDVEVPKSSKVTGIDASLAKASSISGKVTGLNGIELSTVELDLERLGDDGEWYWHADTETDEDGDYELSGLKPGVYRIEFEDETGKYAVEYYNNVVEFDSAENIDLGNEQHRTINASLALGSQITGKITGPNGSPLAEVWVDAFRLNSKGKWEWYEDTEANADGTYQMGGLPDGTYRVGFFDDDNIYSVQFHGSSGSTMYLELAKNFDISFPHTIIGVDGRFSERAATIAGNVRDANGEPLSGVRIEAYRKDSLGVWRLVLFGDMEADDKGFFDPDMLPAGIYRFKFEKEGYITNYYGNSPTLNNAKDIVVGDGEYFGGIDVVMLSENSIPPFISSSPGSASIVAGQGATLSVQASGTNLSYQWYKDDNIIQGANAPSLSLPSAQLSDGGSYTVTVSNQAGTVTSETATLSVITSPSISSPPSSISVIARQSATLSVLASGINLSYQWYKNGSIILGANAPSLSLPNAQVSDAGSYTVKVSNQAGFVTSDAATLTVALPPITSDLSDALVSKGKAITPYKVTTSFGATSYTVKKLPPGLKFNSKTGVISGKPKKPGTYRVVITASKKKGKKTLQSETVAKVFIVT